MMQGESTASSGVTYRDRIVAMYAKYCPEKPLSHVDFLLMKYAGYEEDVLQSLREKYGPEPAPHSLEFQLRVATLLAAERGSAVSNNEVQHEAKRLLDSHAGMEEYLIHSLMTSPGSRGTQPSPSRPAAKIMTGPTGGIDYPSLSIQDPSEALRVRQERFERDMQALRQSRTTHKTIQLNTSALELSSKVRLQEAEIQRLTNAVEQLRKKREQEDLETQGNVDQVAAELIQLKMRKLKLETKQQPGMVSAHELQDAQEELERIKKEVEDFALRTRACEEIISRHLALYPVTPLRQALRRIDPALCARLDTLHRYEASNTSNGSPQQF